MFIRCARSRKVLRRSSFRNRLLVVSAGRKAGQNWSIGENRITMDILGYAAQSAEDDLSPFRFVRREPRSDVVIEILYPGMSLRSAPSPHLITLGFPESQIGSNLYFRDFLTYRLVN